MKFLKSLGGVDAIVAHVGPMLDKAQDMLVEAMGTRPLPVPKDMRAPFMRVVGKEKYHMKK